MIRTVQITEISFDCTLDDWEWTEQLHKSYIGSVWELEVPDDGDDKDVVEELLEEVSSATGWCINSIDFRYILK